MSFFSLADIKVSTPGNRKFTKAENRFDTYNKRYPIDIGNTDKGHYMMFFINVQERTQISGLNYDTGTVAEVLRNGSGSIGVVGAVKSIATETTSFISRLVGSDESVANMQTNSEQTTFNSALSGIGNAARSVSESDFLSRNNIFRTIKRTKDSIALYMPDTLAFDQRQGYSGTSMNGGLAGGLASAGASLLDNVKSGRPALTNMSPFIAEGLKAVGDKVGLGDVLFAATAAATGGSVAVNPQLEMIYTAPEFRSFRFQYMFYPRSEKEARQVLDIIDSFRFHQAPEILSSSYGRYLVPPSEFDIKFYYNGVENPNLPKISTCVLTEISVDYAPNGFASYETLSNTPERGGTGMPVGIRLDLGFQETEIITKQFLGKESVFENIFENIDAGQDERNDAPGPTEADVIADNEANPPVITQPWSETPEDLKNYYEYE